MGIKLRPQHFYKANTSHQKESSGYFFGMLTGYIGTERVKLLSGNRKTWVAFNITLWLEKYNFSFTNNDSAIFTPYVNFDRFKLKLETGGLSVQVWQYFSQQFFNFECNT